MFNIGYSLILLGAFGGIGLFFLRLLKVKTPSWLGNAHGLVNLSAVFLIFLALITADNSISARIWWGLGGVIGALFGGLIFFKGLQVTKYTVVFRTLHGSIALLGIWLLWPHYTLL